MLKCLKLRFPLGAGSAAFTILLLFARLANAQVTELIVPGQNLFVNRINVVHSLEPGLDGKGVTVSIKEFRFDSSDVDLRGRVLPSPVAAPPSSIHAAIMASLVGGAGNADLQGRGVARGCQLISSGFNTLMPDADYLSYNITVQNHAYGTDIQNFYGNEARAYDQSVTEFPALLHVFSAGNKADSASVSGAYAGLAGLANLSGNFKMAKNILVVGSVDSLGGPDPFSSKGPAYDGRIKPDLMAFGPDGSSGAAALVSGAAALLKQALQNSAQEAGADLIRAILINSTDDIGPVGPDFVSGFGNLNLKKAVEIVYNQYYSNNEIQPGQTLSIPLNLPAGLQQFRITGTWTDPAAEVNAEKALVNDLDFELIDPFGQVYFPWILNTSPTADSLLQAARSGRDSLNNVEQIQINEPVAGTWQIRVKAADLQSGLQKFALAWDPERKQHFEWTYPYGNDPAPSNTQVILRWETNINNAVGQIEWRSWPSQDWQTVQNNVSLSQGWLRWTLPDTFTECQLRMVAGTDTFSSFIFLVCTPLQLKIGFNCPDSILLYWNEAHPDALYELYGLADLYMEPLFTLADTFVVLPVAGFKQTRFAVAPLTLSKNALGARSSAPDISTQGVGCYFRNFLAELNAGAAVELKLELGTSFHLSGIQFEKWVNGVFESINEQAVLGNFYAFEDKYPQTGVNTYRAVLILNSGKKLISDSAKVYYGGKDGWWIYPNPVPPNTSVQVISATDSEAVFSLFDVLGKLVLTQNLLDINVKIPLDGLSGGLYFFRIQDGNEALGQGKIWIR